MFKCSIKEFKKKDVDIPLGLNNKECKAAWSCHDNLLNLLTPDYNLNQ